MMVEMALAVDFGSTFTKVTLIDLDREEILAVSKSPTTINTNVMEGFELAMEQMRLQCKVDLEKIDLKLACSSAGGGLRMVALGLVPRLTVEAAKSAALGAGAKVVKAFSYEITDEDVKEIHGLNPDMILLAGGTDGGEKRIPLHNARYLSQKGPRVPYVFAGNRVISYEVQRLFSNMGKICVVVPNVLPEIGCLETDGVTSAIRELFVKHVVNAKGIDKAEKATGRVIMPTPLAVFNAAKALSQGVGSEAGVGDLLVVDVGGATTDIVSMCKGTPQIPGVLQRGLPDPYAKRTVEGDIGVRCNAPNICEEIGEERLICYAGMEKFDIRRQLEFLHDHVEIIPQTPEQYALDQVLTRAAVEIAISRHAGKLERIFTPQGEMFIQRGKDLTEVEHCIATGGPLVYNSEMVEYILQGLLFDPQDPFSLRPKHLQFHIDHCYVAYALGLLTELFPEKAVRIMKRYLNFA